MNTPKSEPWPFRTIATINARGYIGLDMIRHLVKTDEKMHKEINGSFDRMLVTLQKKGVDYEKLRKALIPGMKHAEAAFVFNIHKANNLSYYGPETMGAVFGAFSKKSVHSVLAGDWLWNNFPDKSIEEECRLDLLIQLISPMPISKPYPEALFVIYVTNVNAPDLRNMHNSCLKTPAYIGYADMTKMSLSKWALSTMLSNMFVKCGDIVIQGCPDELPVDEDSNMCGYDFESIGLTNRSIDDFEHGTFLTYKIERPTIWGNGKNDTWNGLNSITADPVLPSECQVIVDEAKMPYIAKLHYQALKNTGMEQFTTAQFAAAIKDKINASYVYNLAISENGKARKFCIILEKKGHKHTCALLYVPEEKTLHFITMY